jgi:Zn finger protein HypA/HybF involved in hydrogenase expression
MSALPSQQQFICRKCRSLSDAPAIEELSEGGFFCRCTECGARNQIVVTGESTSRPGVLPVLGLLD